MSGCELRQYLHISTRKMKYLMDHDLIPHENTGHATHKYLVRVEDARTFRKRLSNDKALIASLTGKFSSGKREKPEITVEITEENSEAFARWLNNEWAELPEALPTKQASEMTGINPQCFNEMVRKHKMYGIIIHGKQYCRKTDLITYISQPIRLTKEKNNTYYEMIKAFLRYIENRTDRV